MTRFMGGCWHAGPRPETCHDRPALAASMPSPAPPFWTALSGLAATALGGLIVVWVFGAAMLDPWNVTWMLAGSFGPDPVQYWLGWRFFAAAPWSLPPGLNPRFGLELSSAIFYADSIPLLALPLKLLWPALPQYWGLWLLGCGMAQGWFGWVLMGHATRNPWGRLAGAGLLALQPMLLDRMGGHLALAGQWTVLAALALALRPARARLAFLLWALLCTATALIHSYLMVMVAGIWAADWLRRTLDRPVATRAAEAVLVPALMLAALWCAGFFALAGGHGAPGYGRMMLDLFAPFDGNRWSSLLPDLPDLQHPEAGNNYLGLGVLGLLLAGLLAWRRPAFLRGQWPLAAALLAMLAFAVTQRVAVLGHVVELFTLPGWAERIASTLRASQRFAWPLLYLLPVLAAASLAARLGGRRAGLLMAALFALQVIDLRPGAAFLRDLMAQAQARGIRPTDDAFWALAARRYERVRAVPAGNLGENWERLAVIAARHGMATDAIYLARADEAAVRALQDRVLHALARGRHEPGTLYMLRDAVSLDLARQGMDPTRDLLAQIDGMDVLAPGWFSPAGSARVSR